MDGIKADIVTAQKMINSLDSPIYLIYIPSPWVNWPVLFNSYIPNDCIEWLRETTHSNEDIPSFILGLTQQEYNGNSGKISYSGERNLVFRPDVQDKIKRELEQFVEDLGHIIDDFTAYMQTERYHCEIRWQVAQIYNRFSPTDAQKGEMDALYVSRNGAAVRMIVEDSLDSTVCVYPQRFKGTKFEDDSSEWSAPERDCAAWIIESIDVIELRKRRD